MLEDLVDNRLLLFGHLDGDPLRDDDGDATTNDVEAWCLFRCLYNQCLLEERVKVNVVVQYVGC